MPIYRGTSDWVEVTRICDPTSVWISTNSTITSYVTATSTADHWFDSNTYVTSGTAAVHNTMIMNLIYSSGYRYLEEDESPATEQDRERYRERRQADMERWQLETRSRKQADERAMELLLQFLTPEQRDSMVKHKHFIVPGVNWRYRIRKGRMANVDCVNPMGIIQQMLCAHPNVAVPDGDVLLAQKLHIETDEEAFLRIANRHAVLNFNEQVLEPL